MTGEHESTVPKLSAPVLVAVLAAGILMCGVRLRDVIEENVAIWNRYSPVKQQGLIEDFRKNGVLKVVASLPGEALEMGLR